MALVHLYNSMAAMHNIKALGYKTQFKHETIQRISGKMSRAITCRWNSGNHIMRSCGNVVIFAKYHNKASWKRGVVYV